MTHYRAGLWAVASILAGAGPLRAQVQGQWTTAGAMQTARELGADVSISGGNVLAAGGNDGSGNILASAEIYNAARGVWAASGSMQTAREAFAAVVLKSGMVLVAGGVGTGGTVLGGAEVFNPATGVWSPAAGLSVARFGHTATLLTNGRVLVTGGCTLSDCSTTSNVSEIYDPATNRWSTTGSLAAARAYHTAVRLKSGAVLAIGGYAGGALSSVELYQPGTGSWQAAASTNAPRYFNGTTLLPDGRVLATGGVITKYPLSSAEIYDPTANVWALTGSLTTARYAHSATLLPDGTVLLAGGEGKSISCGRYCTAFIPTANAEIYSAATGRFTATGALPRAIAYQATTAMKNGRALVNGGIGYNTTCCQTLTDTTFYTPLTLSFSAASVDFGLVQLGLSSATQAVTVSNVSPHASSFKTIAASGDFSQTNTCPATLAAGQSCTITIGFTPTVAGARRGAVVLTDNDPGSPKQVIALSGVGETLALAFTPAALDFGSVTVGGAATQSATLTNDGAAPVAISGFAVAPADGTYTQTNNCPATLGVQQSCTLQVVFTPPDIFTYAAKISVANSAGAAAVLTVSGTGLDGGGG